MDTGKNIFIDFSIIQKSNPKKLRDELEQIIILRNMIFVWSKTVDPIKMQAYCMSIKFDDPAEQELHKTIHKMRKEKKSYKDIIEATGVSVWKIGFYLNLKDIKIWTLDDWIKDYYKKDSSVYQKVDFVIDPDYKFVDRFQIAGLDGHCIEKIS